MIKQKFLTLSLSALLVAGCSNTKESEWEGDDIVGYEVPTYNTTSYEIPPPAPLNIETPTVTPNYSAKQIGSYYKPLTSEGKPDYTRIKRGEYQASEYLVQKGDTLYFVSFITNTSVDDLIRINSLNNKELKSGMVLQIPKSETVVRHGVPTNIKTNAQPPLLEKSKTEILEKYKKQSEEKKKKLSIKKEDLSKNFIEKRTVEVSKPLEHKSVEQTNSFQQDKVASFIWAVKGKVLTQFGERGSKGIEIEGGSYRSILASDKGKVVYVGDGLRGYGNLILIKHENDFITAYGYTEKIAVNEGDFVKKGQRIASVGKSETAKDYRLYFELRKGGKAVNPLIYLK